MMARPGLIPVVILLLLARYTYPARQRSVLPSTCRWDNLNSLDCSLNGITILPDSAAQTLSMMGLKPDAMDRLGTIKLINLSKNRISTVHLGVFYDFSALEKINLSNNRIYSFSLNMNRWSKKLGMKSVSDNLLRSLRVLLLEVNRLNAIPKGLGKLQSLQTLTLSHNRIVKITQDDFANCTTLETIDLQNNRISKIHPDAFGGTKKLKVLRLNGNTLTTIAPVVFMYTHVLQAEVDLSDNPWACDCKIQPLKQLILFLTNELNKQWNVTCMAPANMAQINLLSTGDLYSTCEVPTEDSPLFKTVILPERIKSILHCNLPGIVGNNGTFWWTPQGAVFKEIQESIYHMDQRKNLVLTLPEKSTQGLYICVSNSIRIVYKMHVQQDYSKVLERHPRDIRAASLKVRSAQDFALAVSLSVIITFICAFCLGVFTRPYIEKLWRKRCKSKSRNEQRSEHIYENNGFTTQTLEGGNTTSKASNTHKHVHFPKDIYQDVSPSVHNKRTHDYIPAQDGVIPECAIAIHRSHSPSNENPQSSDLESRTVTQQCVIHTNIPINNKYPMFADGKNEPIDRTPHRPKKGKVHKRKHKAQLETDGMTNQINPSFDVSKQENNDNAEGTDATTTEMNKSPKHRQKFPSSNSQSSPKSTKHKVGIARIVAISHNANVTASEGVNNNVPSRGNSVSLQKDNLRSNQEISMVKYASANNDSSSDDGSFFSFSMTNSEIAEVMEMPSSDDDDEMIDQIITEIITETSRKPEDFENGVTSSQDHSKSSLIRQDTFTLNKPPQHEDICMEHEVQRNTGPVVCRFDRRYYGFKFTVIPDVVNKPKYHQNFTGNITWLNVASRDNIDDDLDSHKTTILDTPQDHKVLTEKSVYANEGSGDSSSDSSDSYAHESDMAMQHQHTPTENITHSSKLPRASSDSDSDSYDANEDNLYSSTVKSNYTTHVDQRNENHVFCRFDRRYYGFKFTVIPNVVNTPQINQLLTYDSYKAAMVHTPQTLTENIAYATEESSDSSDDDSKSYGAKYDMGNTTQHQDTLTENITCLNKVPIDVSDSDSDIYNANEDHLSSSTLQRNYTTHKNQRYEDQVFCRFDRRYSGFKFTIIPDVANTSQPHQIQYKNTAFVNEVPSDSSDDDSDSYETYMEYIPHHFQTVSENKAYSTEEPDDSSNDSSDSHDAEVETDTPQHQHVLTDNITSINKGPRHSSDSDSDSYIANEDNHPAHEDQINGNQVSCRFDRRYSGFKFTIIQDVVHIPQSQHIVTENLACIHKKPGDITSDESDSYESDIDTPQQQHIPTEHLTLIHNKSGDTTDDESNSYDAEEDHVFVSSLQPNYTTVEDLGKKSPVFCRFDRRFSGFKVAVIPNVVNTPIPHQNLAENISYVNKEDNTDESSDSFSDNEDDLSSFNQRPNYTTHEDQRNISPVFCRFDRRFSGFKLAVIPGVVNTAQPQQNITENRTSANEEDTTDESSDSYSDNENYLSSFNQRPNYTTHEDQRNISPIFCRFDRRYSGFKVVVIPPVVNPPQPNQNQTENVTYVNEEDSTDKSSDSDSDSEEHLSTSTQQSNNINHENQPVFCRFDRRYSGFKVAVIPDVVNTAQQQQNITENITSANEEDTTDESSDSYSDNENYVSSFNQQPNYTTHEDQHNISPVFCRFDRRYSGFKVVVIPPVVNPPQPNPNLTENLIYFNEEDSTDKSSDSDRSSDSDNEDLLSSSNQQPNYTKHEDRYNKSPVFCRFDRRYNGFRFTVIPDAVHSAHSHQNVSENVSYVNEEETTDDSSDSCNDYGNHYSFSTQKSNVTEHEDQCSISPVFCRFDRRYNGFKFTVIPDVVHTPQSHPIFTEKTASTIQELRDAAENGSRSYRVEHILHWLDSISDETDPIELQLPEVGPNTSDLVFGSSSGHLTWEIPDFGETNTDDPSTDLNIYSSGMLKSPHVNLQNDGSDTTDNAGGYFVKRKRVFDAFAASLNPGQF